MNIKDILIAARAKIENPENWSKGVLARDKNGECVNETSPLACAYCAVGAILSASFERHVKAELALQALDNAIKTRWISLFNDNHTHGEVLEAFDKAIASL